MKIIAPIDKLSEINPILKAGTDELYFGFGGKDWLENYTCHFPAAQRFNPNAMLHNYDELIKILEVCYLNSIPLFLLVNGESFVKEDYKKLIPLIKKCEKLGVSGVVAADMGLLAYLKEIKFKLPVHYSSIGVCLNSQTLEFLKSMKVKRIVLPQHITIEEIRKLKKNTKLELEAFVFDEKCFNIGGFCGFIHGIEENGHEIINACRFKYDVNTVQLNKNKNTLIEKQIIEYFNYPRSHPECGICSLWDLNKIGIDYVKISGRGKSAERKVRSIYLIKSLLNDISFTKNKKEFVEHAKEKYRKGFGVSCNNMCYYT